MFQVCLMYGCRAADAAPHRAASGRRQRPIRSLCEDSAKTATIIWSAFVIDPFENKDARYLVLVNHLGQHSLWPDIIDVPSGWQVVFGAAERQECLDYVAANWLDIMPASQSPA